MKEIYLKPEMEINEFKLVDVMTTSGDIQDDSDVPFGK